MTRCWNEDPEKRPNFGEIFAILKQAVDTIDESFQIPSIFLIYILKYIANFSWVALYRGYVDLFYIFTFRFLGLILNIL